MKRYLKMTVERTQQTEVVVAVDDADPRFAPMFAEMGAQREAATAAGMGATPVVDISEALREAAVASAEDLDPIEWGEPHTADYAVYHDPDELTEAELAAESWEIDADLTAPEDHKEV